MLFKIKSKVYGAHIEVRVFSGPDAGHLALNGMLRFSDYRRWQMFTDQFSEQLNVESNAFILCGCSDVDEWYSDQARAAS